MALDERSRHEMYLRLEAVLGADVAGTLMEHLPPVGSAHVATKRDLELLRAAMSIEMERLKSHLSEVLDAKVGRQTWQLIVGNAAIVFAAIGAALTVAKLR